MKKTFTFLFSFSIFISAISQDMSIDQKLVHSTVKIGVYEKKIIGGKEVRFIGSGTGFIFSFDMGALGTIPVIVTNRHVVRDAYLGEFYFKIKDSLNLPIKERTAKISVANFNAQWIFHPDTTVDLAVYPLVPLINDYKKSKKKEIFYVSLGESLIPNDSTRKSLTAIEEIFMIGYPYGLRDTINDQPIVRKGITATPVNVNYNSKKEFLADIPAYNGSSGSPVVVFNQGIWNSGNALHFGDPNSGRIMLLGILSSTYTRNFDGRIVPKLSMNIEDSVKVQTSIPLYNIGIVIKAERLLEFKPLFKNTR